MGLFNSDLLTSHPDVAATHARDTPVDARTQVIELQQQVERLTLLNQALWELLREKNGLTDQDLEAKAQEVDLRDGVGDGKMTARPLRCPNCNRISNSRRGQCLYCGQLFQKDAFA